MSSLKGVATAVMLVMYMAACGGRGDRPSAVPTAPDSTTAAPVSFKNTGGDVTFVGDAACVGCHEDQSHGFRDHGMAHSFYALTPEKVVEDFAAAAVFHPESGFYYRPFAADGRYYQEEYRLGPDGTKKHRLVREIKYVVGSGTAARTYLAEKNGRLYEMPLTWYTQKQTWDLSPGYRVGNKRFDRLVGDRCMACHNSYPTPVAFTDGKYTRVPEGIGCERCHGPGSLHVDERLTDPEPAGDVDPTIVNPAHLSLDRRLDVCQQCHLNATVSVLREGRTAYDFRPSQALVDYVALFAADVPPASDQISVISHADRMKQSACFRGTLASDRPMECVTCHNPHEGFRDKGPAYFNQTCLRCHASEGLVTRFTAADDIANHGAMANCIACHMPKVAAEEAPHSSFTDHWIRVVREGEDTIIAPASNTLMPYFDADKQGLDGRRYEGIAYVVRGQQTGDPALMDRGIAILKDVLAEDPEHGEAQYLLGFAFLQRGQTEAAIPPLEAAVRLDPNIPERLNTLALAYETAGRDPVRIARLYTRALSLQPALAAIRVNYGRFLEAGGRPAEALEAYRQAAAEQPWLAKAHYNLGTAYLRMGKLEEAEAALKKAIELEPLDPEARGNLGLLYATRGQADAARTQFEEAVAVAPNHPVALGNLGTYYLNADDLPRAIDLLTRAVEADDRYVDGLANLALAYFRHDDMARAAQYARRVLAIAPEHPLARQILAAL